jgi:hypothetical protein
MLADIFDRGAYQTPRDPVSATTADDSIGSGLLGAGMSVWAMAAALPTVSIRFLGLAPRWI